MISARRILTIIGTLFTALAAGFMMQYIMADPSERNAGVRVASVAPASSQSVTDAVSEEPVLARAPTLDGALTDAATQESAAKDGASTDEAGVEDGSTVEAVSTEPAVFEQDAVELASVSGASAEILQASPAGDDAAFDQDVPQPPTSAPQPGALPSDPLALASLDDAPTNLILPGEEPSPSLTCDTKVVAQTAAAAMVDLIIDAACHASEGFTVHHNGMMVSGVTDTLGLAFITVPALSENAVYIVTFASGETVVVNAEVMSVPDYDRALVQWSSYDGLQVHALEYGAAFDEPGHIWAGASGELSNAVAGEGGFVMSIGETTPFDPHMVEVYTFPSGTAPEGEIELSLTAMVTEANCGRDVDAQVLQKSGSEPMRARDLSLAMPDCDAVGDFLVLKNIFDDLSIARN
ncbi:MAG: hypothetical protein AAFO72_13905 [Pseudomonadota bacterium]